MPPETAIDNLENHDIPRTAAEIARRAIVNHCVICVGHQVSKRDVRDWIKEQNLWDSVSPKEQKFLSTPKSSKEALIEATWRAEAQVALLWAISKIDSLGSLSQTCDTGPLVNAMPQLFTSTAAFIIRAKLRDPGLINEEYEKVYDTHWKTRDAIRKGLLIPDAADPQIIQQRHYAFNWITGYCGQAWDDITTDT